METGEAAIRARAVRLRAEIAEAAARSGRRPEEVLLVAATKTQTAETVEYAVRAGVDACGENRVQELTDKLAKGAYTGAPVHFIGHLQTNKVKRVAGVCDLIQSVDSRRLLEAVDAEARIRGVVQKVLLQVNIGGDPAKFGFAACQLDACLALAAGMRGIRVCGLMTILPDGLASSENRRLFSRLYKLFVDIRGKTYDNIEMELLSMGMSGDFYDAILEGANMVRVGSALFGSRAVPGNTTGGVV